MPKPVRLTDGSGKWFDADAARQFSPVDRTALVTDEVLLFTAGRHFVLARAEAPPRFVQLDVPDALEWLRDHGYAEEAGRLMSFIGAFDPKDEV